MKRVVLIDDHVLLLKPISDYINNNSEFEVVGKYSSGNKLIDDYKNKELDFNYAIVDLMMNNGDGYQVIEYIKNKNPKVKIIIMTFNKEPGLLESVLKSGADGIINKTSDEKVFLKALDKTFKGEIYLCPVIERILNDKRDKVKQQEDVKALTKREREVLLLICEKELSDKEISKELNIALSTVSVHRRHINEKLNVNSGIKLVKAAVELGFLNIVK